MTVWHALWRDRFARGGMIVLAALALLALAGPLLARHNLAESFFDRVSEPPDFAAGFYFGTDGDGRDLFARTLYGIRVSFAVGLAASFVSLVIGVFWGMAAGYFGGRVDAVMMRLVDVLYALPFVFFVILLTVYFGRGLGLIFVAIGAVQWLDMARIVRGQTLALKTAGFVEAARGMGAGHGRIILRHILPNLAGPVIACVTLTVPGAILTESFLSFLGLGIQEPLTSLGVLIGDGAENVVSAPWSLLFPGGVLAATLLSFGFVGGALRAALDPQGARP